MVSRTAFSFYQLKEHPFDVQIRYDTRGHGRTGGPENPEGYISKRMCPHHNCSQGRTKLKGCSIVYADDFSAVAAAYGVKKPFYAGWSVSISIHYPTLVLTPTKEPRRCSGRRSSRK